MESQNRKRRFTDKTRNTVTTLSSKNVTRNPVSIENSNANATINDDYLLPENIKLEANEVDLTAIK